MTLRTTALTLIALMFVLLTGRPTLGGHASEDKPAPPIRLKFMDGRPFDLNDVKADVVVLDFWATWCPPCRKGLPLLQKFHNWTLKNKKSVAIYAVNLREHPSKVRQFWKQQKFNMDVLMDSEGRVAQAYGVTGIPHTAILYNGKIVSVHVGYTPNMVKILKQEVEKLLN